MPTDTLTCHPQRKWKGEFRRRIRTSDLCEKQRRKMRGQESAPKKPETPSDGGRQLAQQLKLRLLEREVSELSNAVEMLTALIDKEELAAAKRLKKITPSNAVLKLWAERSVPPEDLSTSVEERPW